MVAKGANTIVMRMAHFYLALCYCRKFSVKGNISDKELGIQHFLTLCESQQTSGNEQHLDIALFFEKGLLSRREYSRFHGLRQRTYVGLPKGLDLEKTLQSIVLISSAVEGGRFTNTMAAMSIYARLQSMYLSNAATRRVFNRLGLIYHQGSGDIDIDRDEARTMYTRAIEYAGVLQETTIGTHRISALSNLAVSYGQERRDKDSIEKSIELFTCAIDEFDSIQGNDTSGDIVHKCLECHSTSMNNLAVLKEIGDVVEKDVAKAKEVYLRSVEINENPIAMYNLAVLLKCEDPSQENLEQAKRLFKTVADLGADLVSLPVLNAQLKTARSLSPSTCQVLSFGIDELMIVLHTSRSPEEISHTCVKNCHLLRVSPFLYIFIRY